MPLPDPFLARIVLLQFKLPLRLPARAARQLPDQSTTLRVESSSLEMRASLSKDGWRISFLQRELTKGRPKPPELVCTVPRGTIHCYSTIRHATTRLSDRRAVPQRSRANEYPLEFVKSDLTHSSNCYYLIVGNTERGRSNKRPYVWQPSCRCRA
jgi:hypothetical protein